MIYLVQLLFGIVAAITMWQSISTVIGRSTALDRFAVGFDRTVLMDAIYQNVDALGSLKVAFFILLPLYLLVSIVLHGGLLSNIYKGKRTIADMTYGG